MSAAVRPVLGPMMNAVCFQYLRVHAEEVVGRVPIIAAGRRRGYGVMAEMGLLGIPADDAKILEMLDGALGVDGTRLCVVRDVVSRPDGGYRVHVTESACAAGLQTGEPMCAYTLGVFVGALHGLSGQPMTGRELECQAMGSPECVYDIRSLG